MLSESFINVFCNPEIVDSIAMYADAEDPHYFIRVLGRVVPRIAVRLAINRTVHWRSIVVYANSPASDVGRVKRQVQRFHATGGTAKLRLRLHHFGWTSSALLSSYGLLQPGIAARLVSIFMDFSQPSNLSQWGQLTAPTHGGRQYADSSIKAFNSSVRIFLMAMHLVEVIRLVIHQGMSWPHVEEDDYLHRLFIRQAPRLRVLNLDKVLPIYSVRIGSYSDLVRLESRLPVSPATVWQIAYGCPRLQHLLLFIKEGGAIPGSPLPIMPQLHTIVAPSDRLLRLIGSEEQTPALRRIFLEEHDEHPLSLVVLENTIIREGVPMAFGLAGDVETSPSLLSLLLASIDSSTAGGNPRLSVVLRDIGIPDLRTFADELLEREPNRLVHCMTVVDCDLTAATSLKLMSAAVRLVQPHGELRFVDCRTITVLENTNEPLVTEPWRLAVESSRYIVDDEHVSLTLI